jgi:hypothetical protein
MRRVVSILCASLVTSGCATTPSFEKITGVTPKTIVDVLECEIIAAKKKNTIRLARERHLQRMGKLPKNYPLRDLTTYVAVAELTLQVDEQATLVPSFTQTDIISKTFTRAFDWGVKFDSQSHRAYSESITFVIGKMSDDKNSCEQLRAGISLNGKLGIEEVVDMAFGSIDPNDEGIELPTGSDTTVGSNTRQGSGSKGAFGTSLEFDLAGAITAAGPTFTLVHFKGPGKLFSTQRNDTHKITISFANSAGVGTGVAVNNARFQNLLLNNETLPSALSRKIQSQQ